MAEHYRTKSRRKISIFSIIILAFSFIILIGIVITLNCLWNYLEAYENHNPTNVVNKYINSLEDKDYSKAVAASGFKYDYFNDEKAFGKYISNTFQNDFSKIKSLKSGIDGEKVNYNIYADNKKVSTITLIPDKKADKYGMKGWDIKTAEIKKLYSVKIIAPEAAKVFIDDKEVTPEYITSEKYEIKAYSALDNKDLAPKFSVYEVKDLLNKPIVTSNSSNGEALLVSVDEKTSTAMCMPKMSEEWTEEIKSAVQTAIFKYASYTTTDTTFNDLSAYVYKDCEFFRKIKDFENKWQITHTYSCDNVKFKDIVKYDDEHFTASISFTYNYKRGKTEQPSDVSYNTCFIKENGKWLLVTIY